MLNFISRCEFSRQIFSLFVLIGEAKQLLQHLKAGEFVDAKELHCKRVETAHIHTHPCTHARLEQRILRDSDRLCKMVREINTDVSSGKP